MSRQSAPKAISQTYTLAPTSVVLFMIYTLLLPKYAQIDAPLPEVPPGATTPCAPPYQNTFVYVYVC